MPFRAKVKRAFGKNEDPEASSELSQVQSKSSTKKFKKPKVEYPDNVYGPGEIPDSKYKGPYNKEHQVKLHAFSFKTAFQGRRRSEHLESPMGSKLPSRRGSFLSRRSLGRSRQQSRVEDTLMENNEADDAVGNVDMSRQHTTEEDPRSRTRETAIIFTKGSLDVDGLVSPATGENHMAKGVEKAIAKEYNCTNGHKTPSTNSDSNYMDGPEPTKTQIQRGSLGQPFSADDLVQAMTQSTLKPTAVQA
ncbi:MAG: hypothetical protein Q9171_000293 [Xanthocarpia ochracea]